jgi:hypothetical protein
MLDGFVELYTHIRGIAGLDIRGQIDILESQ